MAKMRSTNEMELQHIDNEIFEAINKADHQRAGMLIQRKQELETLLRADRMDQVQAGIHDDKQDAASYIKAIKPGMVKKVGDIQKGVAGSVAVNKPASKFHYEAPPPAQWVDDIAKSERVLHVQLQNDNGRQIDHIQMPDWFLRTIFDGMAKHGLSAEDMKEAIETMAEVKKDLKEA